MQEQIAISFLFSGSNISKLTFLTWQTLESHLQILTEQPPISAPVDSKYVQFSLDLAPQLTVTASKKINPIPYNVHTEIKNNLHTQQTP